MSLTEQTIEDAQRAARTINRILNQPKQVGSAQQRTDKQIEDGIKKLRRVILVEGIPHTMVSKRFPDNVQLYYVSIPSLRIGCIDGTTTGPDVASTCVENSFGREQYLGGQVFAVCQARALRIQGEDSE